MRKDLNLNRMEKQNKRKTNNFFHFSFHKDHDDGYIQKQIQWSTHTHTQILWTTTATATNICSKIFYRFYRLLLTIIISMFDVCMYARIDIEIDLFHFVLFCCFWIEMDKKITMFLFLFRGILLSIVLCCRLSINKIDQTDPKMT